MLIPVDRLLALVSDIFAAAGCSPAEARRVAAGLVDANLTGHDSHGVARVPRYVDWLQAGEVEADRLPPGGAALLAQHDEPTAGVEVHEA